MRKRKIIMNEPAAAASGISLPRDAAIQTASRKLSTPALLIVLYIITVLLHGWLLYGVRVAPYIAHDEVQYCMIGENIRAGHGFTMRGTFATTAPPLFPLFVALGHSLLPNARLGLFFISVLAICTMLFPAFLIARDFGLTRPLDAAAALAATFLPSTFYAGMYMSEILQLPLFLLAFWLALKSFRTADFKTAAWLGVVFGIMALNRFASLTFLFCFGATALILVLGPEALRRPSTRTRTLASLGITIATAATFQGGWWVYKLAHHVSALGTYSSASAAWGHPSLPLFVAYFMDAFIAPGLIVVAPFCVGLRRLYKDRPATGILLSLTVVFLVCTTALSDGSLTGFLRERYFIYCFPLILIGAVLGAREYFKSLPAWLAVVTLAALPMMCLFGLLLYDFHVPALVETSWAHAVGAFSLSHIAVFDRTRLLRNGLIIIGITTFCLVLAKRFFAILLAGYLLVFNLYALARVGHDISRTTDAIAGQTSTLIDLFPPGTRPLQRVVVAGFPPGWDNRFIPMTPRFLQANTAELSDDSIWYLETMKLLDVRMCAAPYCVLNPDFAGAYLLTAVRFPNLRLVKSRGQTHLYRIPSSPAGQSVESPGTYIPADEFMPTNLTARTAAGSLEGKGKHESGLLVFGPYHRKLNRGVYKVIPLLSSSMTDLLSVEVVQGPKVLEVEDAPANKLSSVVFVADPSEAVEFRIRGASRKDFVFKGVELRPVSTDWKLAVVQYRQAFPATQFLTRIGRRLPDGSLTSDGQPGFLCYGPYRTVPAGNYRVRFNLHSSGNGNVRGDVAAGSSVLAVADAAANRFPLLEFSSDGNTPLEFRIVTTTGSDVTFDGAELIPIE
jgi:hypothetical protein